MSLKCSILAYFSHVCFTVIKLQGPWSMTLIWMKMGQSPAGLLANLQCTAAIEQGRGPLLTLIGIERLSWSILHGPLTLRSDSPRAIWPRGNEILSSLRYLLQCEEQIQAPSLRDDTSVTQTHTHTSEDISFNCSTIYCVY